MTYWRLNVCPYCGEKKLYLASHIGAMRRWHPKSHRRKKVGAR